MVLSFKLSNWRTDTEFPGCRPYDHFCSWLSGLVGDSHMTKLLGVAIVLMGMASALMAGVSAPEVDASTGAAALALLAGGVLVLRGRRGK